MVFAAAFCHHAVLARSGLAYEKENLMTFRTLLGAAVILGASAAAPAAYADDFSFTFEWGDIPMCNTGYPNRVDNPIFTPKNVPEGTTEIRFSLTDLDVPSYNHGGGSADYSGGDVIQPGEFSYQSPCPPSGSHNYEWSARARNADGDTLARARSSRKYP